MRANLLRVSVAYDGIRTGHFGFHGQIVCLTYTLPLHIPTCRATRESMAKRPPGTTGVGLLLPSNTRRTATPAGVSGPPVVTSPIMKIGLVNGRTTRPVVRRKKNEGVSETVAVAEVEAVENRGQES